MTLNGRPRKVYEVCRDYEVYTNLDDLIYEVHRLLECVVGSGRHLGRKQDSE